jgi:hypothetical protein
MKFGELPKGTQEEIRNDLKVYYPDELPRTVVFGEVGVSAEAITIDLHTDPHSAPAFGSSGYRPTEMDEYM